MLKPRFRHRRCERGDTIVEVMIVLAVLGLALSISYATANRSLLNARQAQENSQATEVLQLQTEQLRAWANIKAGDAAHPYIYNTAAAGFCFDAAGNIATPNPGANFDDTSDPCMFDNLYHVSISYSPQTPGTTNNNFTLTAQWPDVLGDGTDSVTIEYQVYPDPTL